MHQRLLQNIRLANLLTKVALLTLLKHTILPWTQRSGFAVELKMKLSFGTNSRTILKPR
jgi:hypothetical protein